MNDLYIAKNLLFNLFVLEKTTRDFFGKNKFKFLSRVTKIGMRGENDEPIA